MAATKHALVAMVADKPGVLNRILVAIGESGMH